jgi:uncharacterized membrane protein YphA (DoxX/SURF4 family)
MSESIAHDGIDVLGVLRRLATHPWLAFVLRLYIGGTFVYASMYKINYPAEFAGSIASYELVPYWAVGVMAVAMPWLELVCGLLAIVGVRPKASILTLMGLMALFTLAVTITLARGVPIGCGCFQTIEDPISWRTLIRDLLWLGMTLHIYRYDSKLHLENLFLAKIKEL